MLKRSLILLISLFLSGCASDMWRWSASSNEKINLNQETPQQIVAPPQNITLMLPLKGKGNLALTSQAIRNGFLAAYYTNHLQLNIRIIDTTDGDIAALYRAAVANDADIVVGPLTKNEVETLTNIGPLPVPTIALNTLDNYQYKTVVNLYQFGLLPQDEVLQTAIKVVEQQRDSVAVIAPETPWGNKIADLFIRQYEASGKQVVAVLRYHFGKDLAGEICNFLAYDATKLCVPQKDKDKKQKDADEIMRRQDIDAIFFVTATPAQARQMVPLLKFYYASDLPIYSISTVYSGVSRPDLDQDINDVYFCDIPWVVKSPDSFNSNLRAIYNKIIATTSWYDSFAKYSKFYALGIDAYNLAIGLNDLLDAPQRGIEGASGTLYLDSRNHIYRELQWVQMKGGILKPI